LSSAISNADTEPAGNDLLLRKDRDMHRSGYLLAAESAASILADPAVGSHWSQPSALPEFRVSGLAGHLGRAVTQVERIVLDPPSAAPPIPVLEHFTRNEWTQRGRNDAVHVAVRERGEQTAAAGPARLAETVAASLDRVRVMLAEEPEDRVVALAGQWALRLNDFLLTRTLEIVVHADDLAVSVGIATPTFPAVATEPVIELLAKLSAWRHGATEVMRALTRRERAPDSIAAF
jgi:hypothetical protein